MVHNPAFCRWHPKLDVVYACTESVKQEGQVLALALNGKNGALREYCPPVGAGGTSTCYLTVYRDGRRMLLVNYWDSTISTLELLPDVPRRRLARGGRGPGLSVLLSSDGRFQGEGLFGGVRDGAEFWRWSAALSSGCISL